MHFSNHDQEHVGLAFVPGTGQVQFGIPVLDAGVRLHMKSSPTRDQLKLDFEYDDRVERLTLEFGIMLVPKLPPGTPRESIKTFAGRLAMLASKRLARHEEPQELIRCHSCDYMTKHDERVRVVVCTRCAMEGGTPGSDG